jgi:hypothetical protein
MIRLIIVLSGGLAVQDLDLLARSDIFIGE